MNLRCRHCNALLASRIEPVDPNFQWIFTCEHDVVPAERFGIGDGSYSELTMNHYILHLDDLSGLSHPTSDESRGYGCCGYWDNKGPNLVCVCGAEIGYELSDCCSPRMAHFPQSEVILESEQAAPSNR
jgi:hypothetical protein